MVAIGECGKGQVAIGEAKYAKQRQHGTIGKENVHEFTFRTSANAGGTVIGE
jgi:hypothetical protein